MSVWHTCLLEESDKRFFWIFCLHYIILWCFLHNKPVERYCLACNITKHNYFLKLEMHFKWAVYSEIVFGKNESFFIFIFFTVTMAVVHSLLCPTHCTVTEERHEGVSLWPGSSGISALIIGTQAYWSKLGQTHRYSRAMMSSLPVLLQTNKLSTLTSLSRSDWGEPCRLLTKCDMDLFINKETDALIKQPSITAEELWLICDPGP